MFVLVVHSLMDSESDPCAHDGHNKDQQDSYGPLRALSPPCILTLFPQSSRIT